eukprot:365520-Chlamydomonas_euryale.AAC.21
MSTSMLTLSPLMLTLSPLVLTLPAQHVHIMGELAEVISRRHLMELSSVSVDMRIKQPRDPPPPSLASAMRFPNTSVLDPLNF